MSSSFILLILLVTVIVTIVTIVTIVYFFDETLGLPENVIANINSIGKTMGLPKNNINCIQSEWGDCDSTGNQYRTTTTKSSGNGIPCGNISRSCNVDTDCVETWGACDPNTKLQYRIIATEAQGKGGIM